MKGFIHATAPFVLGVVTADESLFRVPAQSTQLRRQTYTPIFIEDLTFTDEQREVCNNDEQCLYDFAVTGERSVAMDTLDAAEELERVQALLGETFITVLKHCECLHLHCTQTFTTYNKTT